MKNIGLSSRKCSMLAVFMFLSSACSGGSALQTRIPPSPTPEAPPSLTPFLPQIPSATPPVEAHPTQPLPTDTPTPQPASQAFLWLAPYLPAALLQSLPPMDGLSTTNEAASANLRLEVGEQNPISRWIYALVAPFPTITDGVSFEDLKSTWQGNPAGPFTGVSLIMDEQTLGALSAVWGEASRQTIHILPSEQLLEAAWSERSAWAIIPFETLEPRWKVLEVNGQSPVRKEFDPAGYPLAISFSLNGDRDWIESHHTWVSAIPALNRDPSQLTTLVMTGVTALVRATAFTMERDGITSPAEDIGPWLREADLTHISNEVPFAQDCPFPNPMQETLVFCSDPRYITLLEDIGTDIVELTGDHFADWGADATYLTLDMYHDRGWGYYGGGYNFEEGRQPLIIENHGNRLAFIGCNAKGDGYATAGFNTPGAVACDYEWMHAEINRLRNEGYLPIATFQHFEQYTYQVSPSIREDFLGMAEAGAVIVSGSQAHQPQGMEFYSGSFIHYGLGNLFFDQYHMGPGTSRAFIDRHVFYADRHISTELLTIQFINFARSRPMTPDERAAFLQELFEASGW